MQTAYNKCIKNSANGRRAKIRIKIISEETKTKKTKSITYEGPVSGIKEALEQASKDLFKDENDAK